MKTYTILFIALLCFGTIHAQQKIEKRFPLTGKGSVELNIEIADSISIQTWSSNEVYVTASVNINENKDNDAYLTSFEDAGNTVKVNAKFRDNYFKGRKDCCIESDIFWNVFIPEKTDCTVETINADLTIKGETGEMKIKSISGYIDLSVPETRSANLEFSTISGTVYTNHNLLPDKMKNGVPSVIRETMNNGGPLLNLETISGDIFFRKSN